jgi:energy-coupling factor transporter ATP-binding protein EcfA2
MANFDDIRPFNDNEVQPTLQKLIRDPELLATFGHYKFSNWPKFLRQSLGSKLIAVGLRRHVNKLQTVRDFQEDVEQYMNKMIKETISELSIVGIENIPAGPCLFISNHRDIAMDPALINWSIFQHGRDTVRIAIGDNLLSKPWTSDVMRLNKSFIVQRSITAPRKLFAAFKKLSAYIGHSVTVDHHDVWIAQREGRAKDGVDTTEPAIIKMFAMSKAKDQSLGAYLNTLNIVPVSLSYEYDPCDAAKARELTFKATSGTYEKGEHEDIQTIGAGITGFKGRVTVAFGQPLNQLSDETTADEIAALIDQQILSHYEIRPANVLALRQLEPALDFDASAFNVSEHDIAAQRSVFEQRLANSDEIYHSQFLSAYAAPLKRKLAAMGVGTNS